MGGRSEEKQGEPECHTPVISSKMVNFSSIQNGGKIWNRCSRLKNQDETRLLGNKTFFCFTCVWVASNSLRSRYGSSDLLVSDRFPSLKLFREWPCGGKVNPPASFYFPRDACERSLVNYDWKWQLKVFYKF
ncbi:hypothetical protein ILYODFUR_014225 [Ilyodon furcidens]|uniref:Uncharacterized protein n=1 Tax=Ilyodon furcidens TaxID=33524 RepID=A0ABV0V6H9_9TELE